MNISTDNIQVIDLSKDEITSEKCKHMVIKYHLVRGHVKKKTA